MKLSDLAAVGTLNKDLVYLAQLRKALGGPGVKVRIDDMHVRPDLAGTVLPKITAAIDDEEAAIKSKLAALGVEV